jgi:hypothetical protein
MSPSSKLFAVAALVQIAALASMASINDADFQTTKKDAKFLQMMSTFDINKSGLVLEYKDSGTSLGMKVLEADKKVGKWAPQNEATDVEAQVVSYMIGRYLQMSDLVVPSAYYSVSGAAYKTFRGMVNNANERNSLRRKNQAALQALFDKNPNDLRGVFTDDVRKAEAVGVADSHSNKINSSHVIAQFIRADGAKPSSTKSMSLQGVKTKEGLVPTATELELARSFSKIMVLDMLCGQYDRWSGGNVEATWDKDGTNLRFFARDNGGAGMAGTGSTKRYLDIVTRFDRDQISRLKLLQAALKSDAQGAGKSLLMRSKTDSLIARIEIVLSHVKAQALGFD